MTPARRAASASLAGAASSSMRSRVAMRPVATGMSSPARSGRVRVLVTFSAAAPVRTGSTGRRRPRARTGPPRAGRRPRGISDLDGLANRPPGRRSTPRVGHGRAADDPGVGCPLTTAGEPEPPLGFDPRPDTASGDRGGRISGDPRVAQGPRGAVRSATTAGRGTAGCSRWPRPGAHFRPWGGRPGRRPARSTGRRCRAAWAVVDQVGRRPCRARGHRGCLSWGCLQDCRPARRWEEPHRPGASRVGRTGDMKTRSAGDVVCT